MTLFSDISHAVCSCLAERVEQMQPIGLGNWSILLLIIKDTGEWLSPLS